MGIKDEEMLKKHFLDESERIENELRGRITPEKRAELRMEHYSLISEAEKQLRGIYGGRAIVAMISAKHAFAPFG